MKFWVYFLYFWFFAFPVWANGGEKIDFSLLSGLSLLILLFATAGAGFAMLRGKVSRQKHHLLAYITLFLALIHGIYNLFFH